MAYSATAEDEAAIVEAVTGRTIVAAEIDNGGRGFHIYLNDGRVLILTGTFLVGLYQELDNIH